MKSTNKEKEKEKMAKRYAVMKKSKRNVYCAKLWSSHETLEEAIEMCKEIKKWESTEIAYVRDREKKEVVFD